MGFTKDILKEGTGEQVSKGKKIEVHCTGKLENGTKFWSTKDPGQKTFEFQVGMGKVIKGWDEGCLTMRVGEIAVLTATLLEFICLTILCLLSFMAIFLRGLQ